MNLFTNELLFVNEPILDDRLESFEKKNKIKLPLDFKYLLSKHNGFSLNGTEVLGLDDKFKESSLEKVYDFEHYIVENKMPTEYIPFSPDGRENHYCLDLSRLSNDICPIVFWQWDYKYENKEEIETCNNSFHEWVKEVLINWTLDEYNYDGTSK